MLVSNGMLQLYEFNRRQTLTGDAAIKSSDVGRGGIGGETGERRMWWEGGDDVAMLYDE